jgi:hypothetical protein
MFRCAATTTRITFSFAPLWSPNGRSVPLSTNFPASPFPSVATWWRYKWKSRSVKLAKLTNLSSFHHVAGAPVRIKLRTHIPLRFRFNFRPGMAGSQLGNRPIATPSHRVHDRLVGVFESSQPHHAKIISLFLLSIFLGAGSLPLRCG